MAINKAMQLALKALSYQDIDIKKSRNLVELKTIDPFKAFYKTVDYKIYNDNYEIQKDDWAYRRPYNFGKRV